MGSTLYRLTTGGATGRRHHRVNGLSARPWQGSLRHLRNDSRPGITQRQRHELQRQIALATQALEDRFARQACARIEEVIATERQRIAADLHDDLGSKLLMIVHASPNERLAQLGREALDEMRLCVRGLRGRPVELSQAIAHWRAEAMARLSAAGIELDWPMVEVDPAQVMGARTVVQATRIIREAFTNLIRHSRATRCAVVTAVWPERMTLDIRDNGIGFDGDRLKAHPDGLGLQNMQGRARELQGSCRIESRPGQGTHIGLILPLQSPPTGNHSHRPRSRHEVDPFA